MLKVQAKLVFSAMTQRLNTLISLKLKGWAFAASRRSASQEEQPFNRFHLDIQLVSEPRARR